MTYDADNDEIRGECAKMVVWSEDDFRGFPCDRRANIVVPTNVPCREYKGIINDIKKRFRPVNVLNRRRRFVPFPPVLWCKAKTVKGVLSVKPQFDGQIVLLIVDHDVDPRVYVDIVFHAELRGFLVANTGPWTNTKSTETVVWDKSIFVSMLGRCYNRLNWLTIQKKKENASIEEFNSTTGRDEAIVGLCAEECGSLLAYAEEKSSKDILVEYKQKELSNLIPELLNLVASVEEFKLIVRAGRRFAHLMDNKHTIFMETRTRRITIEAELEKIQNQLNAESWRCSHEFQRPKGVNSISRGKPMKKQSWSLFGICASLGLSVLVCSYFWQGGAKPHSIEGKVD